MPGRNRDAGEAGFALIETIASAILLIVVALAVLSSLDAATKTAGANKGRTVAAALAEQDQERMRGMAITQLSNFHGQQTITVSGADYTVDSRADWINDSAGTTQSCSAANAQADYIRITSTVTSGIVGQATKPVVVQGLVSVPVGSFGTDQGTLTIKVLDRANQPVRNMGVTVSGPRSLNDLTNDLGCAVFGFIPVGSYTAQVNTPGWVDTTGQQLSTQDATVSAGTVTTKPMTYDRAASIHATFVDSSNAPVPTAGATKLRLTNGAVVTGFPDTDIAAGQSTAAKTGLFPFTAAYYVYPGSCDKANPAMYSDPVANKVLDPAEDWSPQLRLPTIQVTVRDAGAPVANATVKIRGTAAAGCTGDQVLNATTSASGVASVPMPYGTYDVCAASGGKSGQATSPVANTTALGGPPATVDIAAAGPSC
ncbi:MAG TPA: hypothetical protein VF257_01720 [Solirubrobacteraceae bacterium]